MKVKERVDAIFKEYRTPKTPYKARDLISRLLYGLSLANALSLEAEKKTITLEINQSVEFVQNLVFIHGPWVHDLYKVVLQHCSGITDVDGVFFEVAGSFFQSRGPIYIADLMQAFFEKRPNASGFHFAEHLAQHENVLWREEGPAVAIRYCW